MSKSNHTVTLPREELEELERKANGGVPIKSVDERNEPGISGARMIEIETTDKLMGKDYDVVVVNGKPYFRQRSPIDLIRPF